MDAMATSFATIVAADHPSLDGAVEAFVSAVEPSVCGPGRRSSANREIARPGHGFRLAAVEGDRLVGLARVGTDGDVVVVVAPDRRGAGIGTTLLDHVVERARRLGYPRLLFRRARRTPRAVEVARRHRTELISHRGGRLELILRPAPLGRAG